ncbi:MAG: hypothetical protein AB1Z98_37240 [Nannocystaceae bacterium]
MRRFVRVWANGLGVLVAALGLSVSATGCDAEGTNESREAMAERVSDVLPVVVAADAPLPADREAILRELAPLPSESLLIVYEVRGPGGLTGSLEVLARPGGLRRENWTLEVPLGAEGPRRLDGSTIQTPQGIWIEGRPPETWTASPLAALAQAYLELDAEHRAAFIERLREHRATLADARLADPTAPDEVLGVPCHVTRVASIEMCLWEATGLPLRYEGDGLRLRALNIDDHPSIGEGAFVPPFAAPADAPEGFDAPGVLSRFVEGELGELTPLLHAGLRPLGSV